MPIRKVPGGFKIDNTAGTSPTRDAALRRLAAIKANQGSKSSHNSDHGEGNTHKGRKPRRGGRVTMHNKNKKK